MVPPCAEQPPDGMLQDDSVQVAFRSCGEILFKGRLISAAKAAVFFMAVAAQLKPRPFQTESRISRTGGRAERVPGCHCIVQLVGRTKAGKIRDGLRSEIAWKGFRGVLQGLY